MRTQFIEQKHQINVFLEIVFLLFQLILFDLQIYNNFSLSVYKSTNLQQMERKNVDSTINMGPNLQSTFITLKRLNQK